ncbi:hypothetical protein MRX96_036423 [Rhipicephalus microplus]
MIYGERLAATCHERIILAWRESACKAGAVSGSAPASTSAPMNTAPLLRIPVSFNAAARARTARFLLDACPLGVISMRYARVTRLRRKRRH